MNLVALGMMVLLNCISKGRCECAEGSSGMDRRSWMQDVFARFHCSSTDIRQVAFGPVTFPADFTVHLWLKQLPCTSSTSPVRTLVFHRNHLSWLYNASLNSYTVSLQNSTLMKSFVANASAVYGKWRNFAISNYKLMNLFQMVIDGKDLAVDSPFVDIENTVQDYLFLGTSYLPSLDRFEGYMRCFRLWGTGMRAPAIKQLIYLRVHSTSSGSDDLLYEAMHDENNMLDPSRSIVNPTTLIGTFVESEWTESSPTCVEDNSDYRSYKTDSSGNCITAPTYALFDGTFYVQPTTATLGAAHNSFLSLWFKFKKTANTPATGVMFLFESVFKVEYDRSIGSDDNSEDQSQVVFKHIPSGGEVSVPISRHEEVWQHAACLIEPGMPIQKLVVDGISNSSVLGAGTLDNDGLEHYIFIGGTTNFTYFTGSLREVAWVRKTFDDFYWIASRKKKLSKYFIDSLNVYFYLPLTDFRSSFVVYYSQKEAWRTTTEVLFTKVADEKPLVLCNSDYVSVPNYKDNAMCCAESYLVLNGMDPYAPSLRLPGPQGNVWETSGALCFFLLFADSTDISSEKTLIDYPPASVYFRYVSQVLYLYFAYSGAAKVWVSFSMPKGTWNSVCFSFSVSGSNQIYAASEALSALSQSQTQATVFNYSSSSDIRFLPYSPRDSIYIKSLLILTRAVSLTEHLVVLWGNLDVKSHFAGEIAAWWPMSEPGNLADPVNNLTAWRLNDSSTAPSFLASEFFLSDISTTGSIVDLQPAGEGSRFDTTSTKARLAPKIAMSVDLGDVATAQFIYQRAHTATEGHPLIGSRQTRPASAYFSKYHGLMLFSDSTYSSYVVSAVWPIAKAGVSIWFFKQSTSDKVLVSGWGGSTKGTVFSVRISNKVILEAGGSTAASTTSADPNEWNHLLGIWEISASEIVLCFTLNGISASKLQITTAIALDPETRIVFGTSLDTALAISPGTTFDGYIRRFELINTATYPVSPADLLPVIKSISEDFIVASSKCQPYTTGFCTRCDKLSMRCFPNTSHTFVPDTNISCPASCASTYHTSCDSSSLCSGCNDDLCLACIDSLCIQCKENANFTSKRKCECFTTHVYVSSGKRCEACSTSCKTCSSPGSSQKCTSCHSSQVLAPTNQGESAFEGACENACPSGTFLDIMLNACRIQCSVGCARCTAQNPLNCTECLDGYYFVGGLEGQCVSICPSNTVLSLTANKCEYCHESCGSCVEANNSQSCLSCSGSVPYFVHQNSSKVSHCVTGCTGDSTFTDVVDNTCYTNGKCPSHRYTNSTSMECLACHSTCFGCVKPNSSNSCRGCIQSAANPARYLRLADEQASGGTCVAECDKKDRKSAIALVCYMQAHSNTEAEDAQILAETLCFILMFTIIAYMLLHLGIKGSIGSVRLVLSPLQLSTLLSVITIPKVPIMLEQLFKQMGFVTFEYMPNVVEFLVPNSTLQLSNPDAQIKENARMHPSLDTKLFLVNIGNQVLVFALFILYATIVVLLGRRYAKFEQKTKSLWSLLLSLLLLLFFDTLLTAVAQSYYLNFSAFTFFIVSTAFAFAAIVAIGLFVFYSFTVIRRDDLEDFDVQAQYGALFESTQAEGIRKYNVLVFYGIHVVSTVLVVGLTGYAEAQAWCFIVVNAIGVGWTLVVRPYIRLLDVINEAVGYCGLIAMAGVYVKLADAGLSAEEADGLGEVVAYLLIVMCSLNILLCLVKVGVEIIDYFDPKYIAQVSTKFETDLTREVAGADRSKEIPGFDP